MRELFRVALISAMVFILPFCLDTASTEAWAQAVTQPVVAQPSGIISFGSIFGALSPYIDAIVNGAIALVFGWVAYWLKQKYNIDVEAGHREALQIWAQNQAAALIAQGHAKADGLKFNVSSQHLAAAATSGLVRIPDALKYFGLTPQRAKDFIFDKLPQVPVAVPAVEAKSK